MLNNFMSILEIVFCLFGTILFIGEYCKNKDCFWMYMLLAWLMSPIGTLIDEAFYKTALTIIIENIFYLSTYVLIVLGLKKGIIRVNNYMKIKIETIILNCFEIVIFFFISLIIFSFFDKEISEKVFSLNITLEFYIDCLYPILDFFILLYFTFSQRIFSASNKNKAYLYFYIGLMLRIITDFIDIFRIVYSNNIDYLNGFISLSSIIIIIYSLYYIKKHEMQLKDSAFKMVEYNNEIIIGFNFSTVLVILTYISIYSYSKIFGNENLYYNDNYINFIAIIGIIMLVIQSIKHIIIINLNQSYILDLENRATKDYLTKAYNRDYIFNLLKNLFKYYKSDNLELSVIIIDIDFFKKINDNYGHPYGDFVLVNIVKLIKKCISDNGVIGRHGGEEFIVILPNYSMNEALTLSNQIREIIQNYEFKYKNNETVKVTISIGGETMNLTTKDEFDIIDKADQALYYAKKNRNSCVWYSK